MAQVQLNMANMAGFQPFLDFFAKPLAYSVDCFALLLRSFSFVFGLCLLFHFFTTSFVSLFNHYAHWVSTSTCSYVHTMRVSLRLLHCLPVHSIGHKTGTRRDPPIMRTW